MTHNVFSTVLYENEDTVLYKKYIFDPQAKKIISADSPLKPTYVLAIEALARALVTE